MRVLVTAASKHGATMEIARVIAEVLADQGLAVKVEPVEEVVTLAPYDVVVLGSAIYFGRWLKPAVAFAGRHVDELSECSVWLFSSGPVDDTATMKQTVPHVSPIDGFFTPRGHRVFGGALDRNNLGLHERALVKMVGASYGDFRDWADVRAWATSIATSLTVSHSTPE